MTLNPAPHGTTLRRVHALTLNADHAITAALRPATLPALRILLGVVFVWFGALKVLGASPVATMVSGTLPWADPQVTVMVLGGAEVAFGIALVLGLALRLVLPLLAAHLTGTFLTFVMLPALMFRDHNPFLLTESGEFVAKNLVLIAATIVLICHTAGTTVSAEQASASPTAGSNGVVPERTAPSGT
jgi:putative oxidoreductase